MKGEKEKNIHEKHRERLRNRYEEQGMEGFQDHEALELLLFFTIPRGNTNPTGHALMQTFGSFKDVLEADRHELEKVKGIGPKSALLINVVGQCVKRYLQSDGQLRNMRIRNAKEAGEYAKTLFIGESYEKFYIVSLDVQNRIRGCDLVQKGTPDEVFLQPRFIVELAMKRKAKSVILAHNHPAGSCMPSMADVKTTNALEDVLNAIGIEVLDHIIVAGKSYYSFQQSGLLGDELRGKRTSRAAEEEERDPGK